MMLKVSLLLFSIATTLCALVVGPAGPTTEFGIFLQQAAISQRQCSTRSEDSTWTAWVQAGADKAIQRFPSFKLTGIFNGVQRGQAPVVDPGALSAMLLIGWASEVFSGVSTRSNCQGDDWSPAIFDREYDTEEHLPSINPAGLTFDIFEADHRCKIAGFNRAYYGVQLRDGVYLFHEDKDSARGWEIDLATRTCKQSVGIKAPEQGDIAIDR